MSLERTDSGRDRAVSVRKRSWEKQERDREQKTEMNPRCLAQLLYLSILWCVVQGQQEAGAGAAVQHTLVLQAPCLSHLSINKGECDEQAKFNITIMTGHHQLLMMWVLLRPDFPVSLSVPPTRMGFIFTLTNNDKHIIMHYADRVSAEIQCSNKFQGCISQMSALMHYLSV